MSAVILNECPNRARKEIDLLYKISEALNRNMDLRLVLGPVLRNLAEYSGMLRGALTILNRENEEILIEEAFGLSSSQQARGRYKVGEGITGKVVETGLVAVVPNIADEPMFLDKTRSRDSLSKKNVSFICVPIKIGSEVIGTISVDRLYDVGVPLEEDVRLLTVISSMIAQAVRLRQIAREENEKLLFENHRLHEELKNKFKPDQIIGNSKAMKEVYQMIAKVLQSNTTVLILGESGVGKEMVANAIHYNSFRSVGPIIKVNCSAIPENLIESELFGHEKGAFTGAVGLRKGKFELACGGTLFLDEVGDMPFSSQTKLLRVLQERQIERVGGAKSIPVDVRIIAATNRNLEKMVQEGRFREDLYYRINVFPIHIPPLRERKSDILLLADFFIDKYSRANNKPVQSVSSACSQMLMSYHWPGNVRELENCMERAVLLSTDGIIQSFHLPPSIRRKEIAEENTGKETLKETLKRIEKELIEEALRQTGGNIYKAAGLLGTTERILGLRIRQFKMHPKDFLIKN